MKRLLTLILIACALYGCTGQRLTAEEKAALRAKTAQTVLRNINERNFNIEVDYMKPYRGGSRPVSYGYSLEVRGDTIISYLPYFGRAYNVPYGGGKGLNFKAIISEYNVYRLKSNLTRIDILTTNEEDTYFYRVEVFDNGSTTIDVESRQRELIGYSGDMVIKDDE